MNNQKNKNVGPFLAFDKAWFESHQTILLWLLNTKLIGRLFRWVFCIRECDDGYDKKLSEIGPNYYKFNNPDGSITADFRTHPKYAKRLYYAFKPLWWAFHYWDEFFADQHAPQFSFGFDTLTVYPQAGNGGGNTTCDMDMSRNTAGTFSAIRTGAGENTSDIGNCRIGLEHVGSSYDELKRSGQTFDTSALGSSATISAATESLFENGESDTGSKTPAINIVSFAPAANNTFAASDYGNFGTTKYCDTDISYASWAGAAAYKDLAFNATGLAAISKTGVTKIGVRESKYDIANSDPALTGSQAYYMYWYSADETGTSKDPKLVITYTAPTNYTKNLNETVTIADSNAKTTALTEADSVALADTCSKKPGLIKSESIAIAESVTKTAALGRTESMSMADTHTAGSAHTITDSFALADTISKAFSHPVSDSMSIADAISKNPGLGRTESIAIADAMVDTLVKNILETMTLTDVIAKTYNIPLAASLTIVDAISKATAKYAQEAITMADVLIKTDSKNFTESFSLADALARVNVKNLADAQTIADAVNSVVGKNISENMALADSFSRIVGFIVNISETMAILDTLRKTDVKNLSDSFSITDLCLPGIVAQEVYRVTKDIFEKKFGVYSSPTTRNYKKKLK